MDYLIEIVIAYLVGILVGNFITEQKFISKRKELKNSIKEEVATAFESGRIVGIAEAEKRRADDLNAIQNFLDEYKKISEKIDANK
jgi:hypothetical protein